MQYSSIFGCSCNFRLLLDVYAISVYLLMFMRFPFTYGCFCDFRLLMDAHTASVYLWMFMQVQQFMDVRPRVPSFCNHHVLTVYPTSNLGEKWFAQKQFRLKSYAIIRMTKYNCSRNSYFETKSLQ
jgi:hypothetical protein